MKNEKDLEKKAEYTNELSPDQAKLTEGNAAATEQDDLPITATERIKEAYRKAANGENIF